MRKWLILLLALPPLLAAADSGVPQGEQPTRRLTGRDSVYTSGRHDRLYDSLAARYSRGGVSRLIYNSVFVRPDDDRQGEVTDQGAQWRRYDGRRISRVEIVQGDLLGSDSSRIERLANSIHVRTREAVLRRDLLLEAGDRFDADLLTRSNRNLRSRGYIADVTSAVIRDPADTSRVVVVVMTRDSWSIGFDGSVRGDGRAMIQLYDANFAGTGNRLSVENSFSWRHGDYGGLWVGLNMPNVGGTFFNASAEAGRKWDEAILSLQVSRQFQRTTDFMAGAGWNSSRQDQYMLYADSSRRIGSGVLDLWGGGALWLGSIKSSAYVAGRITRSNFGDRPPVAANLNPAYHDGTLWLASAGLYRERFFTASLIYGYGQREYLPVGYRAEVVGGWLNGEFTDQYYVGGSYRLGGFNSLGYLMGGVGWGGYLPRGESRWERLALLLESKYFTNLFRLGPHTGLRQFVSVSYLQGWNRAYGSDEVIAFRESASLRALGEHALGTSRARLSLETVVFTPLQPWGFRMAMFAFSDLGMLGHNANPFSNPAYATFGLGVRIKNERLVFKAIELRLGVAVGPGGLIKSRWVELSAQNGIDPVSFTPTAPHTVAYE